MPQISRALDATVATTQRIVRWITTAIVAFGALLVLLAILLPADETSDTPAGLDTEQLVARVAAEPARAPREETLIVPPSRPIDIFIDVTAADAAAACPDPDHLYWLLSDIRGGGLASAEARLLEDDCTVVYNGSGGRVLRVHSLSYYLVEFTRWAATDDQATRQLWVDQGDTSDSETRRRIVDLYGQLLNAGAQSIPE